ncbi:uncharacterized protein LOC144115192 isoform X1 [Amblyomma americanum]
MATCKWHKGRLHESIWTLQLGLAPRLALLLFLIGKKPRLQEAVMLVPRADPVVVVPKYRLNLSGLFTPNWSDAPGKKEWPVSVVCGRTPAARSVHLRCVRTTFHVCLPAMGRGLQLLTKTGSSPCWTAAVAWLPYSDQRGGAIVAACSSQQLLAAAFCHANSRNLQPRMTSSYRLCQAQCTVHLENTFPRTPLAATWFFSEI